MFHSRLPIKCFADIYGRNLIRPLSLLVSVTYSMGY